MPRVIWLNGATCSGKTTIARALQEALPETFLWASVDRFAGMLPARLFGSIEVFNREIEPVVDGFHRSIVALLAAGNSVIVDHVLRDETWLPTCVELLSGHEVLFVGVFCAIEVLETREAMRTDHPEGLARRQVKTVHARGLYDVEVDTSSAPVSECVAAVLERFKDPPIPSAFERLSAESRRGAS